MAKDKVEEQKAEGEAEFDPEARAKELADAVEDTNKNLDQLDKLSKKIREVVNGKGDAGDKIAAILFFRDLRDTVNVLTRMHNRLVPPVEEANKEAA